MIVIVGTGLAGYMLAKEFRKLNQSTPLMLITRDGGDFYSKPLLSTALAAKKDADNLVVSTAAQMSEQLGAEILIHTQVESIDSKAKTITLHDRKLSYNYLVLANGACTLDAPLRGNAVDELVSVNTLEEYAQFRQWLVTKKKLAILGSGLVGCEFANDLINTEIEIDIVSLDRYPLAKFVPDKVGHTLRSAFEARGVRWHLGVPAESINKQQMNYQLQLADGKQIEVEGVFSAVGLVADLSLAKAAGLKTNLGVVVNRQLQTSDPHIFALGDCAEVESQLKQYVAPLLHCAKTLAQVLVGKSAAVSYPSMPIVIKTPVCPVVTCPVPAGVAGTWQYEGEGKHLRALFYDTQNQLRGFSLIGDKIRDKFALAKQLPLVF